MWPCSLCRAPSPGRLRPRSHPTAAARPCGALGLQPGPLGAGGIGRTDVPGPCGQWLRVPQEAGAEGVPQGSAGAPGLVTASVSGTRGHRAQPRRLCRARGAERGGGSTETPSACPGQSRESQAGKPGEAAWSWPGNVGTWETEPGSELTPQAKNLRNYSRFS